MINFLLATRRVESTMGITINRLLRYFAYAGAILLATTLGAGSGFAIGSFLNYSGFIGLFGAVAGFGLSIYLMHWARRGRLYQFWAPHLYLFGRLAEGSSIPTGKQQLELGREHVQRLFDLPANLSVLSEQCAEFLRELLIDRYKLKSIVALPLIGEGIKIDLNLIVSPLRDALIGLSLGTETTNPWKTMQDNLALALKHFSAIQRSMIQVVVIQIVGCVMAYVVWYVGIDWLTDHWPDVDLFGWKVLVTGLLTWIMYAAFVYPITVNAMLDELLKIKALDQESTVLPENFADLSASEEINKYAQMYTLPEQKPDQDAAPENEGSQDENE